MGRNGQSPSAVDQVALLDSFGPRGSCTGDRTGQWRRGARAMQSPWMERLGEGGSSAGCIGYLARGQGDPLRYRVHQRHWIRARRGQL